MRFGIYAEMQCPDGKSHQELYWDIFRQMVHADEVGFDTYALIEHHFFPNFGISTNPLAMFTAVAQKTKRIRFRTALHTLPMHNPLKLAGEIAAADILTNGRLECGVGRGHAWICGPANIPLEESRPRYEEALEILVRAWTEERFSHEGRFWKFKDVTVVPKPIQKPYPRFFTGGTSSTTYQMAGEKGWGIFVPPLLPWSVLEEPLGIYKEACRKAGHEPDIIYLRPVYIDEDEKKIREEVEGALHNFLKFNASPLFQKPSLPPKEELEAKGYGFYASGALESLTKLTYDQIVDQEIGFIGTPDKVIRQVEELQKKGGIGELTILTAYGGIEPWKSIKTQELFAKHVLPEFRKKVKTAATTA